MGGVANSALITKLNFRGITSGKTWQSRLPLLEDTLGSNPPTEDQ
jgi:hypothetical protein